MTEHDDAQLIDQAFNQLSTDVGPAVLPPGGVRETIHRRRTTRINTLTAAGALVVVLSIATFMGTGRGQPGPDPAATAAATSDSTATPVTPSPSPTRTDGPSPSVTASPPVRAPITLAQLTAAPVGVPTWPWSGSPDTACASGRVRLAPSADVTGDRVGVVSLRQADLDEDAAQETAALIRCGYGAEQVVAFDRDADGEIITLGQVVATLPQMPAIISVAPRNRGGVTATVADTRAGDDQRRQDRQYAWDGERFRQVGGPTSFPSQTRPVDLGLTVATPVAEPVSGACEGTLRDVSVTFTVKNHSTVASDRFHLEWRGGVFLPNGSYEPPYWLDTPGYPAQNGGHRALQPGERVNLEWTFKMDACVDEWGFTTEIRTDRADPDPSNSNVVWWLRVG